jgi:hypothetical protein
MATLQTAIQVPFDRSRRNAARALSGKLGRGRFGKQDARYDPRRGQVELGVWIPDRTTADYAPYFWRLKRATFHWRKHAIVVDNALNFEFQIDEEVPFAHLTHVAYGPNKLTFTFGEAMRITIGVSDLNVSSHPTDAVRTDWGVKGFALR